MLYAVHCTIKNLVLHVADIPIKKNMCKKLHTRLYFPKLKVSIKSNKCKMLHINVTENFISVNSF